MLTTIISEGSNEAAGRRRNCAEVPSSSFSPLSPHLPLPPLPPSSPPSRLVPAFTYVIIVMMIMTARSATAGEILRHVAAWQRDLLSIFFSHILSSALSLSLSLLTSSPRLVPSRLASPSRHEVLNRLEFAAIEISLVDSISLRCGLMFSYCVKHATSAFIKRAGRKRAALSRFSSFIYSPN